MKFRTSEEVWEWRFPEASIIVIVVLVNSRGRNRNIGSDDFLAVVLVVVCGAPGGGL